MKEASVYYREDLGKNGSTVTFLGWKNIARAKDLPDEYKRGKTWFCESENGRYIELWNGGSESPTFNIGQGTSMDSYTAYSVLNKMKALGEKLSEINKEIADEKAMKEFKI
jgi:hypothetical protein